MHPTAGHATSIVGVAPGKPVPEVATGMRRAGADVLEVDLGVVAGMPVVDLLACTRAAGGRLGLRVGGAAPGDVTGAVGAVAAAVPVTHLADPEGACDPPILAALLGSVVPVVVVGGPDPVASAACVTAAASGVAEPASRVYVDPGGPGDPARFVAAAVTAVGLRRRNRPVALTVPAGVAAGPAGLALVAWAVEERVPLLRAGPEVEAVAIARRVTARLTSCRPGRRCRPGDGGDTTGSGSGP